MYSTKSETLNLNMQQKMFRREEEEEVISLPIDIYAEILHRLPSNDLLNFKLVCKDWNLLISSPEFIQKHLERSNAGRNEPRILIPSGRRATDVLDCANINTTKRIPLQLEYGGGVLCLGTCDGLVLYYNHNIDKIGAFNPCTGKHDVRRPTGSLQHDIKNVLNFTSTWFGRHPSTGEYVLVFAYEGFLGLGQNKHIMFKVYSLSHGSLLSFSTKEVDSNTCYYDFQDIATFSHGRLHIPGGHVSGCYGSLESVIITYDFQKNEISRARGPPVDICPAFSVNGDGRLCGICRSEDEELFEVWVVKDQSWTKFGKIEGYGYAGMLCPLGFCGNGDVILDDQRGKVTRYSFRDKKARVLKDCHKTFQLMMTHKCVYVACVDSLVSPAAVLNLEQSN